MLEGNKTAKMSFRSVDDLAEFVTILERKGYVHIMPEGYRRHGLRTLMRCVDRLGEPCDKHKIHDEYVKFVEMKRKERGVNG